MNKIKAVLIIFLSFNLFFHVIDWNDTKKIFIDFKNKNEYQKQKVRVDSIEESSILLVESAKDIIIYKAYYSNPKDSLIIKDNSYSIYLSNKEKPNIIQFLEYHKMHNDSIYIWHHPTLEDKYAKENEVIYADSFIWSFIVVRLFFFTVALTTLFFLMKKILLKKH